MMLGRNVLVQPVIERLPENSVGVELGVWRGETSIRFLRSGKVRWLYMVDAWSVEPYRGPAFAGYLERYAEAVGGATPDAFQRRYDEVFEDVALRFSAKPVTILRMTTREFFRQFVDQVDWVYVDASHAYDDVLADLDGSLRIVKPGGSIFGDDYNYTEKPDVTKAVDAFVRAHPDLHFASFGVRQFEICTLPA